ncbi:MAG: hypothetical protein PHP09_02795 [Bacilli bacterium]|jgi:hypothetical protein|nr:hypothetical protein [Bacilli bacterium]
MSDIAKSISQAIKDRKVDYLSEDTNGSVVILIANRLSMFPISGSIK